jgi:ABC-type antimicrobial peptide transport system permease subunit
MKQEEDILHHWSLRWFRFICPPQMIEEIEGDLLQQYGLDIRRYSKRKARRKLAWRAISYFRPGILLRHKLTIQLLSFYMVANYFKISSRVMLRNKAYSLINILGLSTGIAGALLLFLWIHKETTFDDFHINKDHLYQAWNRTSIEGTVQCWNKTPRILAPTLVQDYSGIQNATSFADYDAAYLFTAGDKKLMKNAGTFVDDSFLSMFTFPMLKGDPAKAFADPSSIVITENFAQELFEGREALGETVTLRDGDYVFPFKITGILKDLPDNTQFHFQYLIPFKFLESLGEKDEHWDNNSVSTFVQLKEGVDVSTINKLIRDVAIKHSSQESKTEVFLYPLDKLRLYSRFENGSPVGGRIEIIRLLGILAICLLVIACINFINLSTARAQRRAKEVGIRKVTGAYRLSIITQFLCESVLVALIAGIFSLAVVYLVLPMFSTLIEQPLTLQLNNIYFWGIVLIFFVVLGIMAGSYPAFYLSSFHPVKVIKSTTGLFQNRSAFRKTLVIFQFSFAITLVIAAIVVRDQIEYAQQRNAGYSRDGLIYQYITGDLNKNYTAYKNELLQSGTALSVTKTFSPVTEIWSNTWALEWEGKDPESKIVIDRFNADEGIAKTAGLKVVRGRDMDLSNYPTDSSAVVLNEAAVNVMGFDDPIGKIIKDGDREWHVIGVVKDFVLQSPFQHVRPMVILGANAWFNVIHIKLNPNKSMQENLSALEKLYAKYNPDFPFDYTFVDEAYNAKFNDQKKTKTITLLFTALAIFISCLGLLGLSTYLMEVRIKEIGIRKVLGASVTQVARMLSKDLLKHIMIGIAIGMPIGWWAMTQWLMTFDYRTPLKFEVFLLAAVVMIALAWITIIVQTVRAARSNPADTLKNE